MKSLFFLVFATTLFAQAFAATSIPKEYQGMWAESKKACILPKNSPIDFPDSGTKIDAKVIMRYENPCNLKSIKAGGNPFTGVFTCYVDGESSNATITLRLSQDGKLIGLSDKPLVRC